MASVLFEDYEYPVELYNRQTGHFTTPIKTLLQFTPHILEELPKEPRAQKPIKPATSDPSFSASQQPNDAESYHNLPSYSSTETGQLMQESFKFCVALAKLYVEYQHNQNNGKHAERDKDKKEKERKESEKREKERLEKEKQNKKLKKTDYETSDQTANKKKDPVNTDFTHTIAMSAVGLSALTLSLYSTYRASSVLGEVSFHDQLELLLAHVESILQSTRYWVQEREGMKDVVPEVVRRDVVRIEEIIEMIQRLDPRHEKKIEVTGWAIGAAGSLGVLGGIALGSAAVLTGGGAVAVGGLVVGMYARGRYSGKQYAGSRAMLEGSVHEVIEALDRDAVARSEAEVRITRDKVDVDVGERERGVFVDEVAADWVKVEGPREKIAAARGASRSVKREAVPAMAM